MSLLKNSLADAYGAIAIKSRHDSYLMWAVCCILDEKCDPIKWASGGYRALEDEADYDFRKEVVIELVKFTEELLSRGVDLSERSQWDLGCDFFKGIATSIVIQFQD